MPANANLQAELLRARSAVEEARADAELTKAKYETTKGAALRDAPRESHAPLGGNSSKEASTFGKYQAKVKSLEGEVAQLKAQLEQQQQGGGGRRNSKASPNHQSHGGGGAAEVPAGAQSHVVRLGGAR